MSECRVRVFVCGYVYVRKGYIDKSFVRHKVQVRTVWSKQRGIGTLSVNMYCYWEWVIFHDVVRLVILENQRVGRERWIKKSAFGKSK